MVLELKTWLCADRLLRVVISSAFMLVSIGVLQQAATAQQAEPAATVTFVTDATVGPASASVGSTVFSGDVLRTGSAGQLQFRAGSIQFVLEPNSAARIFKIGERLALELEQGTIGYSTNGTSEPLALFAQDVRVSPDTHESAAGRVSIISPCSVRASAVRGSIDATSGTESKRIEAGKSYSVLAESAVQYNLSWKPLPPEYPDYPRDAEYHHSHSHVSCVAKESKANGRSPASAGNPGHFELAVKIAIPTVAGIVVIKALESPDKP